MHQHPRPSPKSSSPATNPRTNPERTNNPRDQAPSRNRSDVDLTSYTERAGGEAGMASRPEGAPGGSQDKETVRLNQIIQQFHTKSALMICGSRAHLPPAYDRSGEKRQNRWFNIIVDETDVLLNDLQEWRRPDLYVEKPPPLVIEVALDTSHLRQDQALLYEDENGQTREVPAGSTSPSSPGAFRSSRRYRDIVLERWTIELGDSEGYSSKELSEPLPTVYKKGIVAFRTLYSQLRMLPAWKLYRQLSRQPGNQQQLRLKYRIRQADDPLLHQPLTPQEQDNGLLSQLELGESDGGSLPRRADIDAARPVRGAHRQPPGGDAASIRLRLRPLTTPAGPLLVSVDYRRHCGFRSASGESVLSARLSRADHGTLGRSLPEDRDRRTSHHDRPRALLGSAYGSLNITSSNQRDDMKRLGDLRDESGASPIPPPNYFKNGPLVPPSSHPKESPPSKPTSSSLSQSPRPSPRPSPHPIHPPSPQYASGSASSSKRTSLNTLPQQQLRHPSATSNEIAVSSTSSSPKPAPPRFSSSFANRPRRWTSQSSKAGESGASSGGSSKEKLRDPTEGSSGDARTDDDDIASFISDLEKSKDIKFATPPPSRGGNVVNLAKYNSLRNDSSILAEEMSSSSLIQASSTPPSRRMSNVPGLSTSSSPSRGGIAHAPYVRSRLSVHSIVERGTASASPEMAEEDEEVDELPFAFHD